jgi:hypothetical protein
MQVAAPRRFPGVYTLRADGSGFQPSLSIVSTCPPRGFRPGLALFAPSALQVVRQLDELKLPAAIQLVF